MTIKSWVIEAIEREAMKRAANNLLSGELIVLGLDVGQIAKLKEFYEARTGRDPTKIGLDGYPWRG